MLTCSEIRRAGRWNEALAVDTVILDFDARHRRRIAMTAEAGLAFLLDLPRAAALRDGDGLVLDDGHIVRVQSAPERLLEITAADAAKLVRVAWHLGNRHVPVQVLAGRLHIRRDRVILEMLEALGAIGREVEAPFDPEGGAFEHEHSHGHR